MILEREALIDRVQLAIEETLVHAAIQSPEDEIATWIVPSDADGGVYVIDGLIDIRVLAAAVADEIEQR